MNETAEGRLVGVAGLGNSHHLELRAWETLPLLAAARDLNDMVQLPGVGP